MRIPKLLVPAVVALLLMASCGTNSDNAARFDVRSFAGFTGTSILCFDLRDQNDKPVGGLLLRVSATTVGRRDILVPFPAEGIPSNRNVLLASGTYDRFTILSFSIGLPSVGMSSVSFVPITQTFDFSRPSLDMLDPGVYYVENGLERWFIFRDPSAQLLAELRRDFPSTNLESFDSVAVAIPEKAEGREVKRGVTVSPPPSVQLGNVMLFERPTEPATPHNIAVRYVVQPTAAQAAASASGVKLIFVLFVPIATLLFLNPDETHRPRARKIGITIGVAIQVAIVTGILLLAYTARPIKSEAWVDLVLAGLGIVSEIAVIWIKSKPRTQQPPQKPPPGTSAAAAG